MKKIKLLIFDIDNTLVFGTRAKLMDIKIETTSNLTRGMTVADRRNWGDKLPNVEVVTRIDKKMFIRNFLQILGK